MDLITDKQSREIANAALKSLQEQQITDAQSVRELIVENPFQFINEICRQTIKHCQAEQSEQLSH